MLYLFEPKTSQYSTFDKEEASILHGRKVVQQFDSQCEGGILPLLSATLRLVGFAATISLIAPSEA